MKSLRSVMSGVVACLVLVPAIAVAEAGTDTPVVVKPKADVGVESTTISKMTIDDLFNLLAKEGLVPERRSDTAVRVKMEMITVLFLLEEDQLSLQAFAGFRSEKANLTKVNEWNRNKRYSRAYIDGDGDPVIELDLDLRGGVTPAGFVNFLNTVRLSVVQYSRHVFE